MTVDRRAGEIRASDNTGSLLLITLAGAGEGAAVVRMSGPALDDPARRARMAHALSRVLEGPEPAC